MEGEADGIRGLNAGIKSNAEDIEQGEAILPAKRARTDLDVAATDDDPKETAKEDDTSKDPNGEDQQEFISSEFFKIEILNLPTPISFPEARRLVQLKLNLQARKVKLSNNPSSPPCIFATFQNEEAKQRALAIAHGYEYRQHKLIAKSAKVNRGREKKHIDVVEYKADMTCSELEDFDKVVVNSVAPLQHLPYTEQLDSKHKDVIRIFKSITYAIVKINPDLRSAKIQNPLNLEVGPPLPSSSTDGYRNKNEFTIGRHPNGDTVVGFRVSSFRQGSVHVGSPRNIKTVGDHVKAAVLEFEAFLKTSKYEPYDPVSGKGLFRTLAVRDCNERRQLMFLLIISGGMLNTQEFDELSEALKGFYLGNDTVISCYIKVTEIQGQKDKNPLIWIFGQRNIFLNIQDLKFEIAPDAFFQVNTQSANVLFDKIVELGGIDSETSVIDVCCGTGTIGISAMLKGNAAEVIGIELVESAIDNARRNVELNFSDSAIRERFKFFAGRAEELVEAAGNTAQGQKIVAIVDPPRSGLTSSVIAALRKNSRVRTIVYVACKLEACKENFVALARPQSKKYSGAPFIPMKIISIDMFPHTKDVECIVLFNRYSG